MSDKPEIKVGQKWVTHCGDIVEVLHIAANGPYTHSVTVRGDGDPYAVDLRGEAENIGRAHNLISLAPTTVKRTVALYRSDVSGALRAMDTGFPLGTEGEFGQAWTLIAEGVEIEFTLLPGEEP